MAVQDQPTRTNMIRRVVSPRVILWLVAAAVLAASLVLVTIAIENDPVPSQDQTVLDWVVSRDYVSGLSEVVTFLSDNRTSAALGLLVIAFFWLVGLSRAALAFAVVGGVIVVVAFLGDTILGEAVGRSTPLDEGQTSFPSGHVFGSTVFYGFWGYLV